ncbi:MAG: TIGR03809 family protein [Xanthobacteraceae bacterium]
MSVRLPAHALDEVAQKWRALAERRLAHFVELCESGRWRRYYSEEQFLYRMREAIRLSERWAQIARGRPGEVGASEAQPLPDTSDRTAA